MSTELPLKNIIGNRKLAFKVFISLTIISFFVAVSVVWNHVSYQEEAKSKTKKDLIAITKKGCKDLDGLIQEAMVYTDKLADEVTSGTLSEEQILDKIQALVLKKDNYYGSTVAYKRVIDIENEPQYAPYFKRNKENPDSLDFSYLDTIYNYTDASNPDFDWYKNPISTNKGCWVEPYYGMGGKTTMITYSKPFYKYDSITKTKEIDGVVTLDISMDHVKDIIENIDLGRGGFGALISAKGKYLYHPNSEYVRGSKTIREIAKLKNDKDRLLLADRAERKESGIINHISTTTGKESWLVYAPIPTTGWSLQNTFLKNDIEIQHDKVRRQIIWIAFSVLIFLLFACLSIYVKLSTTSKMRWVLVAISAIGIVLAIDSVWDAALTYNATNDFSHDKITDRVTLSNRLNDFEKDTIDGYQDELELIPTGVFIDAIKFSGSTDIIINGFIWQKYKSSRPDSLIGEISIAKATNLSIQEIGRTIEGQNKVVQYSFEAEIRQNLSSKTYPLEEELLEIEVIPKALNSEIGLIPDLDAYMVRSASQLPGVNQDAFISGWKLTNSFYELRHKSLNTNFGIKGTLENKDTPSLFFSIRIQRNFIDAFISNLTPLIIVSIMLFLLLLVGDRIDTSKIFSICIAMFFVIVFSHIDIRGKISAQEIFYLEYFFFLTYGLILYLAMSSIGLLLKIENRIFKYSGHQDVLLFWPTVLGIVFLITVFTFY